MMAQTKIDDFAIPLRIGGQTQVMIAADSFWSDYLT